MDRDILHTYIDIFRDYVCKGEIGDTFAINPDTVDLKYCNEHYKEKVYENARSKISNITASSTDDSVIASVIDAIKQSDNLIRWQAKAPIIKIIKENEHRCAQVFRTLYCNKTEVTVDQDCFTELTEVLGKRYQTLSYLFFIKDKDSYLPASPENFDFLFSLIGIDEKKMSHHCTWDNYNWFISNVRAIQEEINECLHLKESVSLLTSHSIVWILDILKRIPLEVERAEQKEETYRAPSSDKNINLNSPEFDGTPKSKPPYDTRKASYFRRDRRIAQAALKKANHKCEFDNEHPTFTRKSNGEQYTEAHHLIPLAYQYIFDYSLDNIGNVVSLCSHCHNRLHYGKDLDQMIEQLFEVKKGELQKAGLLKDITLGQLQIMYK